ncbi:primase-helicase zinc-binding domain-containing protein [Kingella oralis]|uniref:Zinc-binding domain of primase-helicase n=1 Tax=Kingella oralis ATCC 51147 TaxID=629741 RepID=C4GIX4_9NEIS|nr:primase-helicase zinc-binding domain-containing protein [Kingella oralis]EEP67746.1 Zinc-binding domain of primase-helicase [Kingella oralis ATCC 51147]
MNDLREQARHHWQGILGSLGISGSLKNKHQPCPCCGGKDRFRFDDKDGYGTFICNQCGAGDGFKLIMNLLHCDFKHAASIVEGYLGTGWVNAHPIAHPPIKTQEKPEKQQDKQAKLLSIFEQAQPLTPDSPAVQYLHQRGITLRARVLLPKFPKCYVFRLPCPIGRTTTASLCTWATAPP